MENADTIDKDALRSRIEEVLSDILSEKYKCKVTLTFDSKQPKRRESA